MFGNFDTAIASNLMVVFEKCDPNERSCKPEAEIQKWMTFKYIFTLENHKKFVSYKFGEEAIQKNSYGNWYSLNYSLRSDFPSIVKRSTMKLSDHILGIGDLLAQNDTGFILEKLPQRFLPYDNLFQNAITYEISMTRDFYSRQVYTVITMVSDVGGLFGGIAPLCSIIVLMFQYHGA